MLPSSSSNHRLPSLGLPGAETSVVTLAPPPPPDCATQLSTPEPLVLKTYPLVPPVIVMFPTAPRLVVPDTVSDVSVPTEVMFGCAAVVTVPAVVALPAVATFRFATCVIEVTVNGAVPVATFDTSVEAVTVPLTPNEVNVPTDVMFGCAAVVTVPAVVALPAVATFRFAT